MCVGVCFGQILLQDKLSIDKRGPRNVGNLSHLKLCVLLAVTMSNLSDQILSSFFYPFQMFFI